MSVPPALSSRRVLLLRGINVGGHKKVPMEALRRLLSDLGCSQVSTLLNSGNAVFDLPGSVAPSKLEATIESAIEATFGFPVRTFVLNARQIDRVMSENPMIAMGDQPSRLLVAFLRTPADRSRVAELMKQPWGDDRLEVGSLAAYLWCHAGISRSDLPDAVGRAVKGDVTMRNWATVLKIQALCHAAG